MLTISEEDIVRRIRTENPWWGEGASISESHRGMKPRAYLETFFRLVSRSVKRAVVLMGPRRVGKTVMIHHTIQSLLRHGVPPTAVCYISVDSPIYNGLRLEQLLRYYSESAGVNYETDELYVFFDEIQYLRKWEVQLKSLVDSYPKLKCVASGSAAAALRLKSEESGAGRFTDFLLPPLTFYEYLDLLNLTGLMKAPSAAEDAGRPAGYFSAADIGQVNDQFLRYLNYGGYPEVVFSEQIQEEPARFIKSDIIDKVLLRDLPSLYGIEDIQELNYLFTTLAFNTANEISLQELAQNSGVAKNTIKKYLDYLEAAFLIKIVHRIDHTAKRFRRANYFKVYLTNPSMRAALFSPIGPEDKAMGSLAETAIFSQWFHSDDLLHYARWQQAEVDIVMLGLNQKPKWTVEVKWSDRFCTAPLELSGLLSFMKINSLGHSLVTSRTKTEQCELDGMQLTFIPAAVYCYGVGYNVIHSRRS